MRVEFYGLVFETPAITFHLWSPWRSSALEHRLFESVRRLLPGTAEQTADEWRAHCRDAKSWKACLQAVARVMKGWQEEAAAGQERRSWRWLLESDTDVDGYDHAGEKTSLWGYIRVAIDRGGPGEPDKGEDLDLDGFGIRIWGER
jgi:hypothetical protein